MIYTHKILPSGVHVVILNDKSVHVYTPNEWLKEQHKYWWKEIVSRYFT